MKTRLIERRWETYTDPETEKQYRLLHSAIELTLTEEVSIRKIEFGQPSIVSDSWWFTLGRKGVVCKRPPLHSLPSVDMSRVGESQTRETELLKVMARRFEKRGYVMGMDWTNMVMHRTILFVKHGDKRSLIRGVGRAWKISGLSDEEFFLNAECIRIEGGTEADV